MIVLSCWIFFFYARSLQGLDNTAADGAIGFQTMERIVDDLKAKGKDLWRGVQTQSEDSRRASIT